MSIDRESLPPQQPIKMDLAGCLRFQENAIVSSLLETSSLDMNKIAVMDFSQADREQFAQLIGYSLSGYSELSYVRDETYERATNTKDHEDPRDAQIRVLRNKLAVVRSHLREVACSVFAIHPDDLHE